jgi:hypothetical protein
MLKSLIMAIIKALFGEFRQGVDDKRDDQAHEDLGAATERAQSASDGLAASKAMTEAKASADAPGAAETALDQGAFLLGTPKSRSRK